MRAFDLLLAIAVAALVGAVLGWVQGLLLRRRLRLGVQAWWPTPDRLHWLAAAVAATLAVKIAFAVQPPLALSWLPLALIAPWLVGARSAGLKPSDYLLVGATFFTLNGVVLAMAFTGRTERLLSALLGSLVAAGAVFLVGRVRPGLVGTSEVGIAALVGIATGAAGLWAVAVALLWAGGVVVAAVARRRPTGVHLGIGLLAGAWVAGVISL
jgi:hypothetical protein